MTYPLLNAARLVMFVVAGAGKAAAVRTVLKPDPDAPEPPAHLVRPEDGDVVWVLDGEAGSQL